MIAQPLVRPKPQPRPPNKQQQKENVIYIRTGGGSVGVNTETHQKEEITKCATQLF